MEIYSGALSQNLKLYFKCESFLKKLCIYSCKHGQVEIINAAYARVDQKCLSYNSHKWEISFHTIPYVQKIAWKLYNKHFSINGNCILGVFSINQKVVFCFLIYFLKKFGLFLQPNTSEKDLGYSKHQRLDSLTFTMHKKTFSDDYFKFLNFQIIRHWSRHT